MTRNARWLRNAALILGGAVLLITIAALVIVRTDWFREAVRRKIIASTEEATGGRAELGSFSFDVSHMHASMHNFVIHGKEPSGVPPFVRIDSVDVNLRLFTSLKRIVDITFLAVSHPHVNVIVFPDGTTSLPSPKQAGTSNNSPLATVVDLAVGRFDLSNGLIEFANRKQELNLRGSNLRAVLDWNVLKQSYQGELSMEPLYVLSGRNTPVQCKVTLPVVLERDRIGIQNASITTPQSSIRIDASIAGMKDPRVAAHIGGHIALADLKSAANLPLSVSARNAPSALELDSNITVGADRIDVTALRAALGKSNLEASGTLQDPQGTGSLQFKTSLSLAELSRLANLGARTDGEVLLNGTAKLDAAYNYQADGNIEARNLSVVQGRQQIRGVNLVSALHVDPHHVNLRGLRLSALGGEFKGDAALEDFARYRVDGNLRNLNLAQVLQQVAPQQRFPYDGVATGTVNIAGDTRTPGSKSLVASAKLNIAPGHTGIPITGKLDVDYRGASDQIALRDSYLALPHSKLNISGSVGTRLDLLLTSTDLDDLLAAFAMSGSKAPVRLVQGQARFSGAVTGSLTAPRVTGHLAVDRFAVEGRQFNSLQADLDASKSQAAVSNGALNRAAMNATFSAQVGLRDWDPAPTQKLIADVALRNGDLADLIALAGESPTGYSGTLSADAHINGTVGNPQGSASIQASNGSVDGEHFDQLQARVSLSDQLVTLPAAFITTGPSRIDISGEFQHPRDSFSKGRIHGHAQSNQFDLARIHLLQEQEPNTGGTAQLNVDVVGQLGAEFVLTAVNGDASIRGLRIQGTNYGDLTADARTAGQSISYHASSNFSGATVHVNGTTQLSADYPTDAAADIRNLPVAPLVGLAKQQSIPVTGKLSGNAHFSGTVKKPRGDIDLDLANAVVYDEPFDHIRAKATYLEASIDVPQFEAVAGPSRIAFSARYDHPAADLESGKLQFRVDSSRVDLARLRNIQQLRPGLAGNLQISGDGAATVRSKDPRVLFTSLNATVAANGISAQGKNLGDARLTANTMGADRLKFTLSSNLAGSTIDGEGSAQLSGNYPVDGQVAFKNVTWSRLEPVIGTSTSGTPTFDGAVDGQITVNGPVLNTSQLRGSLNLARLSLTTIPRRGSNNKPLGLQNDGPIVVRVENGVVRLQNVKLAGPKTTIEASGTAPLQGAGMNLTVKANVDLALLQGLTPDIDSSSGAIVVATTVHGTISNPQLNGTLDLQNAGLHYAGVANGLSKATGTIVFNSNSANIRNLSAETGGGTIIATGFVGFADKLRFGLRANASRVRILTQQDVTLVTNADVRLTGTTDHSLVSGTVTVMGINYRPQSDIGSLLTRAAPPVQVASAPSPLLENMRLDIRVRTSPTLMVQASVAQNLQADADLHIRGTAAQPGILGRVNISEGQLVFFGSTYSVNSGTIGFYNPLRIEPILDVSLETQAKGVDVILHVTGPIDNMKLSYTSDPPLQFQEIVSLLAAGKTPTSDPTLLANQPSAPQQSFQQMGESALVSKAIADPISSQLQRVFGVSQLKIDPTFTTGSQVPQARLTLQQQVSSNITFTYVSALDDPNSTVIRVEWAFDPKWSAVATRDENGIFSINLFYKKQFR